MRTQESGQFFCLLADCHMHEARLVIDCSLSGAGRVESAFYSMDSHVSSQMCLYHSKPFSYQETMFWSPDIVFCNSCRYGADSSESRNCSPFGSRFCKNLCNFITIRVLISREMNGTPFRGPNAL